MAALLERPRQAEGIKLPERFGSLARHVFWKVVSSDPGELPQLPNSGRTVARKL